MEWQQLAYFHKVAQLQHFTRAAAELSISQPALSRSIARLEEELGVPLFERRGRTVILNRYGEIFLRRVNRAMQEISYGRSEIQDLIDPEHGTVSLAFLPSFGTQLIPDLLHAFRLRYPRINFQLHQDVANPILDMLEAGEIDFCLSSPVVTRKGIQWMPLLTEELFIVVPKTHRLANRTGIKLNELAEDQFVFLKKGYTVRTLTEQYCQEAGFAPKIAFVSEEIATAAGLVTADLGVALLPNIKRLDTKKVSRLRVSQPKCRWVIGIGWVEGRYLSPAAGLFKQFVMDNYRRLKYS